jgi:hypothetical protein
LRCKITAFLRNSRYIIYGISYTFCRKSIFLVHFSAGKRAGETKNALAETIFPKNPCIFQIFLVTLQPKVAKRVKQHGKIGHR